MPQQSITPHQQVITPHQQAITPHRQVIFPRLYIVSSERTRYPYQYSYLTPLFTPIGDRYK